MKKKYFFFFIIALYCWRPAKAQSKKDSLLKIIAATANDTNKVQAYIDYGSLLQPSDPDSAAWYYQQAGSLSNKLHYLRGELSYISCYSDILFKNGQAGEAIRINRHAIQIARKISSLHELAKAYNNLASAFNYKGLYDSAIVYYLRSANLFEKIGQTKYLSILYGNVAALFEGMGQMNKAYGYSRKTIIVSEQINDSTGLCTGFINAGGDLIGLKRYDHALDTLNRGLLIAQRLNNIYYEIVGLVNKGEALYKTGKTDEGINVYKKALQKSNGIHHQSGIANSLSGLATGFFNKKNYSQAQHYLAQAIALSRQNGYFTDLTDQLKKMSVIQYQLHDFSGAYNSLNEYLQLNDSLTNLSLKKSIDSLEMQYQNAKKDKEIIAQQLQIEKNTTAIERKNKWLAITGFVIVILLLSSFLLYRNYRQKQKLNRQAILTLQKEQEVIRLKSQMEGQEKERLRIAAEMHDDIGSGLTSMLFLTNSVQSPDAAITEKMDKINRHASSLVDKLNEIIWALNKDYDSAEDLIAYIRQHIGEMMENAGIDFCLKTKEPLPAITLPGEVRRNIYLVIKEAVHNIIKHACASKVNIQFNFDDKLTVSIQDNGRGIDFNQLRHFGNGLKNMQRRMENINGEIVIKNEEGANIILSWPLAAKMV